VYSFLFDQKLDKDAKAEVDAAVAKAKTSPEPLSKDLWTDIYYKGTEPSFMRGREREEVSYLRRDFSCVVLMRFGFVL